MSSLMIYGKEYQVLDFDDIVGKHFGFIYITENNLTGKKYLGLHNVWKKDYLGSGNYLRKAIAKHGRENFTRYIIDVADSYEELTRLEAEYITEKFGVDLAKSDDWYNITSGLQRGGNTWLGMTPEDRAKRSAKVSKANTGQKRTEVQIEYNRIKAIEWYSKPGSREKVSLATKKAMRTPEMRKKLSELKKGVAPTLTPEQKEAQRQRMSLLGQIGRPAWNKGMPMQEEEKERISKTLRKEYDVFMGGKLVYENLSVRNGYAGVAKELKEQLGLVIGKHRVAELILTGDTCDGYPRHPELEGIEVVANKIEGSNKHLYTVKYKGATYLDNQPIKGSYGEKGTYIANLVGVPEFRDKVFIKLLKSEGAFDGEVTAPELVGLRFEIIKGGNQMASVGKR